MKTGVVFRVRAILYEQFKTARCAVLAEVIFGLAYPIANAESISKAAFNWFKK